MSSSIDWFDCPKCGGDYTAYREQDNRMCEVYCGCSECDWYGEQPVEPQLTECKNCGKKFSDGSLNNPDFCSDDCNYDYHADQLNDPCEQCKKLGENTCGNDIDCRCFELK